MAEDEIHLLHNFGVPDFSHKRSLFHPLYISLRGSFYHVVFHMKYKSVFMRSAEQKERFREFLTGSQAKILIHQALQKMIKDDPEMQSLLQRIRLECNLRGMNILYGIVLAVCSFLSILASANEEYPVFSELLVSW
jgi:hypothetical protein